MAKRAIGTNPLAARKGKRPVGRPPAGLKAGERVKDYQRTTLWLPPDAKRQLDALSRLLGRPQWGIVVEALPALEKTLSAKQRAALRAMA